MHARQAIREAVVAKLSTAATAAEGRVFPMRFVTYTGLTLPAIGVYATKESVDPASRNTAPRYLARDLQITVEAVVKYDQYGDKVETALDAISLEIERAMHADPTFGGVAGDSLLASTDLDVLIEGDRMVGVARLTYTVDYETQAPDAADVTLVDLKTVDAKTSLGGAVNPGNQAEDKLVNLDT